jgi:hypothetical protein
MRYVLLIYAGLCLSLRCLPAEDKTDRFYGLAPYLAFKNGSLEIGPYTDSRLWLNGVRQPTHSDVPSPLFLKPRDTLYQADSSNSIYRYQLEALTAKEARFSRWTYSSVREKLTPTTWNVRLGKVQKYETLTMDITWPDGGVLTDTGPSHVETK